MQATVHVEGAGMPSFTSKRYRPVPGPRETPSALPGPCPAPLHIPLAAVSWVSHENPPSSLPAVGGEERREGNKAEVAISDDEGTEHLHGGVWDQALMIDGTPAVFSQHLGRPAVEYFRARRVSWGVGSCFWELAALWKRRRWGSPVQTAHRGG